jgi:hypothetical protein
MDVGSVFALTASAADAAAFASQAWPPSLRSLELDAGAWKSNSIGLQLLVGTLPISAARLQSLTLTPFASGSGTDLTPLLQLPQLTHLFLPRRSLTRPQLAVVKQLHTLTELGISRDTWRIGDLHMLLSDGPHQLQRLQKIMLQFVHLDVELLQSLLALPSLTELEPMSIDPSCFPLLHSLSFLRKLVISPTPDAADAGMLDGAAIAELLSSLRGMPNLSYLVLGPERPPSRDPDDPHPDGPDGPLLNYAAWRKVLDGLDAAAPQLRELTLIRCTLPSLAQLNAGAQLRVLRLDDCRFEDVQAATTEEFQQWVRSMRHLERLTVIRCFLPLSDPQRQQLSPPSFLLPSLRHFHWEEEE